MNHHDLLAAAKSARRYAHAPYSRFRVGAALLGGSGTVYTGCNVESSSYGLTICAERTALVKAVSEGERTFVAIAIVQGAAQSIPPCGACRQMLLDVAGDIDVVTVGRRGAADVQRLSALLPHPFRDDMLRRRR